MNGGPEALLVSVTAPDAEVAVSMQDVVARHLDRFAFREAPLGVRLVIAGLTAPCRGVVGALA